MIAYYNEIDPYAAQWLRNLIGAGHLPKGHVDERDIREVQSSDLDGYGQCHFFAGIGGWALAARLALWPDDRPIWTGSCPCQPFSVAGKRGGTADDRHLWPEFARLIGQCEPTIIFGEQVAGSDGRQWLNGVRLDLEALGYAVGAADLCAAGVGAPHIRQRLWWVADSNSARQQRAGSAQPKGRLGNSISTGSGENCGLANDSSKGLEERTEQLARQEFQAIERSGDVSGLEHAAGEQVGIPGRAWEQRDTVDCADGKTRTIESGTFPLAHGISNRVGRLRAYGNAIVPQVAAEVIKLFLD